MIKYIKSVLWRVAKRLSYIEEARCLKVNLGTVAVLMHRRVPMKQRLVYFMNSGTLVVALYSGNLMACSSVS